MKKLISLLLILSLTAIAFLSSARHPVYSQIEPEIAQKIDFKSHFEELGVKGSIVIYDLNGNKYYEHNPIRNQTAVLPASTYKIPNSLIALETGVIKDDVAVLTWDGIERGFNNSPMAQWNQDLNLRLAFKYSAVWFYQVLARRIGYQRMQDYINKIEYGNQNIGQLEDIDLFWLSGKLKITPKQQITFLRRLYQNDLPFSQNTMNLVKDIAIAEQTPNYILRAKTGWATSVTPNLGWYVGYIEQQDNVYFFATNLDMNAQTDPKVRLEVTRRCLQDLGLF